MAVGPFVVYDHTMTSLMDGSIDLDSHTFKMLYLSNSYTPSTASNSIVASISAAELSASNGTSLRQTLSSVTWARSISSGVTVSKFKANDVTMSTSSTIKVRYVAIYDDTHASDALVAFSELTSTGTGVPCTQLTVQIPSSGIFKLRRP